jgi:hypothetical protein
VKKNFIDLFKEWKENFTVNQVIFSRVNQTWNLGKRKKMRKKKMSTYNKQIGGTHYKKMKIQPSKFVIENKLLFPEGNVIKYICRHKYKGGKEDLEKAKHFIDMIIERDYK